MLNIGQGFDGFDIFQCHFEAVSAAQDAIDATITPGIVDREFYAVFADDTLDGLSKMVVQLPSMEIVDEVPNPQPEVVTSDDALNTEAPERVDPYAQ